MSENYLVKKRTQDHEKKLREWRINVLEQTLIPFAMHELKTLRELSLGYDHVSKKLTELRREYKHLTGHEYQV